jgi:two-component system cell cycle sensor histidine kinase/response regulator CckA
MSEQDQHPGFPSPEIIFPAVIDYLADLIEIVDPDGRILYTSPSYKNIIGKSEETSGGNLFDTLHPEDRSQVRQKLEHAVRTGEREHADCRFIAGDGSPRYIESDILVLRDAGGEPRCIIVGRDTTQTREAESKERLLAYALSCTRDCFCLCDLQETILFVNSAFCTTYGYSEGELIGNNFSIIHTPQTSAEVRRDIRDEFMRGGWYGELLNRRKDGTDFAVELWISQVRDHLGEPVAMVGIARDITQRKRTEELLQRSERKFRSLIDNSSDGIALLDAEAKPIYFSPSSTRLLGYSNDELMKMNVFEYIHPDDVEDVRALFAKRLNEPGTLFTKEFRIKRRDGSWRWLDSMSKNLLQDPAISGIVVNFKDITEQKHSEKIRSAVYRIAQAADQAETLDKLYRAVHEIIGTIMPANNFYIALYDDKTNVISFPYFVDELDEPFSPHVLGKGLSEYVLRTGKSLLCTSETQAELERSGEAELVGAPSPIWLGVPLIIEKKSIGIMTVQHYSDPTAYGEPERQILEFVSSQVAKAIEQKHIDEALRKSEERYRAFVEQSSDGIWRLEFEHPIATDISEEEQVEQFFRFGYLAEGNTTIAHRYGSADANEIIGTRLSELFRKDDESNREFFREFIRSRYRLIDYELCQKISETDSRYFLHNLIGIVGDNLLYQAWGTQQDITAKKEAEKLLRMSEEKYRTLFEESHDGILLCTPEGRLIDINQSGVELFGYDSKEKFLHATSGDDLYFHAEERKNYWHNLERQGFVLDYEFVLTRKDGQQRIVLESTSAVRDERGKIISYRRFLRDITERKMLEEELRQAQKMEGIGTLAGGIAHDFNNLLGIILGYATLLDDGKLESSGAKQSLDIIKRAVDRGASLVRQLLTFARRADPSFESVNVNVTIKELIKMLQQTFPKTIAIVPLLAEKLPWIVADSSQLHQALLNLSVNARDAMSEEYGGRGVGTLTIQTGAISGHVLRHRYPTAEANEYIFIKVMDTGIGMDEATRQRMFEPFFTTKGLGKGTGLGLAVVYGVVNSHHGFVDVESDRGKGTTFSLYFPVQPKIVAVPEKTSDTGRVTGGGGNEVILIVEDEETLRELLKNFLEERGYRVLTAGDGLEGLEIYREHYTDIALVLSDMGLPRLGGWEMFQKMREINPAIAAILASGYFDPRLKMDMLNAGAMDFIQKPYVAEEVHRRIREIIDQTKVSSH